MKRTAMQMAMVISLMVLWVGTLGAQPTPMDVARPAPAMAAPASSPMTAAPPAAMLPAETRPVVVVAPTAPVMAASPMTTPEKPPVVAEAAKKESGWDKADKWLGRILLVLGGLLGLIGMIISAVKGKEWRKKLQAERAQKINEGIKRFFPVVEALAKITPWKGDDKLVEMLVRIDEWLFEQGESPMSVTEHAVAAKTAADLAVMKKNPDEMDDDEFDSVTKKVTRGSKIADANSLSASIG